MDQIYLRTTDIKPALSGYLRQSLQLFAKDPVPDEKVIHDVRVYMKRARAILRLIAPGLDSCSVRKDIIALKEIGRQMSGLRELSVHRKNLKILRKQNPELFSALEGNDKIRVLMQKQGIIKENDHFTGNDIPVIIESLRKSGFRIRFYPVNKIEPLTLVRSLGASYGKLVTVYLTCRNDTEPEHLHELRKRSKDFLYQLSFFRSLDPGHIKALEKKVDALTRDLGRYNDLVQLIKALDYNFEPGSNPAALDELVVIIRNRQDKYLTKIWPAAYRLFPPGRKLTDLPVFRMLTPL